MSYKKEKKIDFPPDYAILTQTYNGPASHIKVRHKLCDNVFRIRIRNLIKDNFECPYCSGQVNKNNRWFRNKVKALYNDDITVLGDFINEETKVLIEYKLCGHQTLVAPKKLIDYTQSRILKKCPQCGPIKQSANELSLGNFVAGILPEADILLNYQGLLPNNKELDIYIPSLKIAIEYDGIYYHSDHFNKNKYSHRLKHEECEKLGIRLIEIFSDEYNFCSKTKKITQNLLKSILTTNELKTVNNDTVVCLKIDSKTGKQFLSDNHLKGYDKDSHIYMGMYTSNDKLIMVVSLKKTKKNNVLTISRVSCHHEYRLSSLFPIIWKYILAKLPQKTTTVNVFVDRRWGLEEHLREVGFKFKSYQEPKCFFVDKNEKVRRIEKEDIKKNKSQYFKIYDAGYAIWSFQLAD